ncbi:methyltransferase domain-containing protein, partial [Listeria monocytogenes]|uniref:methyltransferase domain-containing protein n=1 Tax=Listeria monocytogenes TaxID=1639 RepID=UPI002FDC242C
WDLTNIPWPLPDESVLVAMASHVIEHIQPADFGFINFMNEVWRLLKPGGEFAIVTPHGRSDGYIQDPTHVNPCNEAT